MSITDELPSKVKNPWACENDPHGSGFMGMELEIYLCPRCGSHPSMVDEDGVWQGGGTGLLCMECGFGTRPQRGAVKAVSIWNRAVEQYCNAMTKMCELGVEKDNGELCVEVDKWR